MRGKNSLCVTNEREDYMYLYLMETENAVKIGVSKFPELRRNCLQTGCFEEIKIRDTYLIPSREVAFKTEKILHAIFADYLTNCQTSKKSGEWFSKEILGYLNPFEKMVRHWIAKCRMFGTVKRIDDLKENFIPTPIEILNRNATT